jgi:predicted transcriptional regulator
MTKTFSIRIQKLDDALVETASVWKAAEKGKKQKASTGIGFASYEDMHRILTPKRLDIVRALAGNDPMSIREVARRVERDFKGVHTDVVALASAGVIDRTGEGVSFPYDRIHFEFDVSAAA